MSSINSYAGLHKVHQTICSILLITVVALAMLGCQQTQVTTSAYSLKTGGVMPASQQGLSINHAKLEFTIAPKTQSIEATASLQLNTDVPRDSFSVDLDRVFTITEVVLNDRVLAKTQFANNEGMLLISAAVKGDFTLVVKYQGHPRIPVNAPWDGGMMWAKTPSGQPWIATAVQGEGCDLFWPCIDHPFGEPSKVDLYINVPKPLVAASNGVLVNVKDDGNTRTYHWQTTSLHNTYGIALNIAPYALLEQDYTSVYGNNLKVQFFHLPERAESAAQLFDEIPQVLDFFERMIGPYPFMDEKVGVVETPHLGMEHQTINAYGNEYKKDEYGFDWLLHHEFAHEWFGNQMTNDNWDHIWLHEGFGTYMQPLYAQYLHGDMAYKAMLAEHRVRIANKFPIVSKQVKEMEEVYTPETGPGGDVYFKGSWVLHTLRHLIGDDAFFKATKQLVYNTTTPTPGDFAPVFRNTRDFIDIVNQTTDKDLSWFFDVYLYQAKLPKLITQRTQNSFSIAWEIENNKPFLMPVDIQINGVMRTLYLSQKVSLDIDKMDVIIVDPQSKILKHEQHIEDYKAYLKSQK